MKFCKNVNSSRVFVDFVFDYPTFQVIREHRWNRTLWRTMQIHYNNSNVNKTDSRTPMFIKKKTKKINVVILWSALKASTPTPNCRHKELSVWKKEYYEIVGKLLPSSCASADRSRAWLGIIIYMEIRFGKFDAHKLPLGHTSQLKCFSISLKCSVLNFICTQRSR